MAHRTVTPVHVLYSVYATIPQIEEARRHLEAQLQALGLSNVRFNNNSGFQNGGTWSFGISITIRYLDVEWRISRGRHGLTISDVDQIGAPISDLMEILAEHAGGDAPECLR